MKSFKKSYVIYIKAMKETHTYILLLYFQVCHLQHRLSCQGHELTGLRAARLLFFCALKFNSVNINVFTDKMGLQEVMENF